MFQYRITRVYINTTPVFVPGGDVNRWTRRVAFEVEKQAKLHAPPNRTRARWGTWATGRLVASIDSDVDLWPNRRTLVVTVGSDSPHARFVHEGTANSGTGYIYTTKGWANPGLVDTWIDTDTFPPDPRGYFMRIPRARLLKMRVRGQKPNPFLVDGYNAAARIHRALPPMGFG